MKLIKLIKDLDFYTKAENLDVEVTNVTIDSNSVVKGSLFIAITGSENDGHDYIRQAENYGAVAIVCEREVETSLPQIIVNDSRIAMSKIAAEFYRHPEKKLKLIVVVGTNVKTTTTHIIKKILEVRGINTGLIGTLGAYYNDKFIESSLTTPDPLELYKLLDLMQASGVKVVVMEVSAHAIILNKINDLYFDVGVFTNFSQDHLDFFDNMENYKMAKLKFFTDNRCKYIVTNSDDELGVKILKECKGVVSYGIVNPSDVFAIDVVEDVNYTKFVVNLFDCVYTAKINLIGYFNVYNCLAAATATALLGVPTKKIIEGLSKTEVVNGRLECVYNGEYRVFVDYAHTPDGLEKSLSALRHTCLGKLICVFGCGGNRDKQKRGLMGRISGENSDFSVITSDNPRYEEPMEIISDIEKGILEVSSKYVSIATEGDVVLIAGKGGEKYQEVLGIKHLYNDKDTIEKYFQVK